MRNSATCLALALLLLPACKDASAPPPPEPPASGAPPMVAPPPPHDLCPPFPPGYTPPPDRPSAAECEILKRDREQTAAQLRRDIVARDPGVWIPDGGLPALGQRIDPNPDRGSWMQQLTPTRAGNCTFTPREASERPADAKLLAWSGNMDLYGQGNILAHDHALGFVEAGWLADRPLIAVRQGMLDLWIAPQEPWEHVTLIISGSEFYCQRWKG